MHSAHRLTSETAITGKNQALGLYVFEAGATACGHFLRTLNLQRAVADHANSDLLVLGNTLTDMGDIRTFTRSALNRQNIDLELVEILKCSLI